jgi:RimJ/RimL family protein N-acetyltransferase
MDPEVARHLLSRPATDAAFRDLFARNLAAAVRHGMWAVCERDSGRAIGRVGFFEFGEARRPELAFLLARAHWGRGLATESARAALAFGFAERGFAEVVALVRAGHAGAIRVLEKLGMAREGREEVAGAAAELFRVDAPGPALRARAR